jgi:nucleotide-binding universal stress UspA family protein
MNAKLSCMSEEISNIMVCIDGSKISVKAARRAFDLAKKYTSEVTAIYVSVISDSISRAPQYARDELYKYDAEQMNNWLKDVTLEAKQNNINFKIKVNQTNTSIVEEVIKNADAENIDLIVIGSTGKSKLERIFVGSVAQGVISNAKCSILLVR